MSVRAEARCGNCTASTEGECLHAGEVNCSQHACQFYLGRLQNDCKQSKCPHYQMCVINFNKE